MLERGGLEYPCIPNILTDAIGVESGREMPRDPIVCSFCRRVVDRNKLHHLIPKMRHRTKRMKRLHTKEDLGKTIDSCIPCHDHLHALFTEKDLAETYNTIEKLLEHPDMRIFVEWVKSKPASFIVRSKWANSR
jgi:hypothetical protein